MLLPLLLASLASLTLIADPARAFRQGNLVAWCVVPFDAKKRGPEERVAMLHKLGFTKYAYDWRAEHLPTFDRELAALKRHDIALTAVWFPDSLNGDAKVLLAGIERHKVTPQLWVMLPDPAPGHAHAAKLAAGAAKLAPLADAAAKLGCRVSLYNHGGWGGEPDNMLALIAATKRDNVGIAYNLHHVHARIKTFADDLARMAPKLDCLNLNGTDPDGDAKARKILVLGTGTADRELLDIVARGTYCGPIGILGHTNDDAAERLQDNLDGLRWALGAGRPPAFRTSPRVALSADGQHIVVADFPGTARPAVTVHVRGAATPMLGATADAPDAVTFTPRFPLTAGVEYVVEAKGAGFTATATVRAPAAKPSPVARVTRIDPVGDTLPENLLRFYVHFDRPMTRGQAYQHLTLKTAGGATVAEPFLELDEELWSADGLRFTLLLDPGRVKRGLKPRDELGPALTEGTTVTLEVGRAWPDELGRPLGATFRRAFRVAAPDGKPIDPGTWTVTARRTGPIRVEFDKPLDRPLAERLVTLLAPDGTARPEALAVDAGNAKLGAFGDARSTWPPGEYRLRIDTRLEDPCGNRVGRAFEVDLLAPLDRAIVPKTVERKFVVR